MKKEFTYDDVIFRIGYYRNKNNLSARDLSLQLDYGTSQVNRIERKKVELKVSTLLKFMELVGITPLEFFYPDLESYKYDIELIKILSNLSSEDKQMLIALAKKIK